MSLLAYIDASFGTERRSSPRTKICLIAKGEAASGGSAQIVIHDISETGMLIEWGLQLARGELIEVELPDQGSTRAVIVWSSGPFAGCQFAVPIGAAAVDAALRISEQTLEGRFDQKNHFRNSFTARRFVDGGSQDNQGSGQSD